MVHTGRLLGRGRAGRLLYGPCCFRGPAGKPGWLERGAGERGGASLPEALRAVVGSVDVKQTRKSVGTAS